MVKREQSPEERYREEYAALRAELASLHRNLDHLFLRALEYEAPLTLYSAAKPAIPVRDNIGDLQRHIGDESWLAESCKWQVKATLYEYTDPINRGRKLVLSAAGGYRDDLSSIDPNDLDPPGDPLPWQARAVELS